MAYHTVNSSILRKIFRRRSKNSRKYDFGHLLVIGGSNLYHGSPLFAAMAAYRSGTDLVTIAAPRRAADIIAAYAPDLITYPLKGDFLTIGHLKDLSMLAKNKTAIVIGGGLGREMETMDAVNSFLAKTNLPCVIDADAIHAVAMEKRNIRKNFVFTPHSREFLALTGINVKGKRLEKKIIHVRQSAASLGATVLLKGNVDIISDGKQTALNKTGNPYMTKGGTGDTLAGICGSLLAQGNDPFISACGAAYINGKAGDIAAKKRRQSMIASDLVESLCSAIGCA